MNRFRKKWLEAIDNVLCNIMQIITSSLVLEKGREAVLIDVVRDTLVSQVRAHDAVVNTASFVIRVATKDSLLFRIELMLEYVPPCQIEALYIFVA